MSEACDQEQENAKKPKVLEQIPKVNGAQLARRRHWLRVARFADAELPFKGIQLVKHPGLGRHTRSSKLESCVVRGVIWLDLSEMISQCISLVHPAWVTIGMPSRSMVSSPGMHHTGKELPFPSTLVPVVDHISHYSLEAVL